MEHISKLDAKLKEFVEWMGRELVPKLSPDFQQTYYSGVKANWEKAEQFKGAGGVNPLVHAVIGPTCLKMYDDIKHVHHYLAKTEVPAMEIVQMDFFPGTAIITDPERMFKEAAREDLAKMFQYFIDFGRLYYKYMKETDPVLMSLSKGKEPVDSK